MPGVSVNWANIGSDNSLSPVRRKTILGTNAGLLLTGPLRTDLSETGIKLWFSHEKNEFAHVVREMAATFTRPFSDNLIFKTPRSSDLPFQQQGPQAQRGQLSQRPSSWGRRRRAHRTWGTLRGQTIYKVQVCWSGTSISQSDWLVDMWLQQPWSLDKMAYILQTIC